MKVSSKENLKRIGYFVGLAVVAAVVGLSLRQVKAWTEPAVAPPNANIGAPINTGGTIQAKSGGLRILGNVGIGTNNPNVTFEVKNLSGGFPVAQFDNWDGTPALQFRPDGALRNIFIGVDSGKSNPTGFSNNGFGSKTLASDISGSDNNAFGTNTLKNNTTGTANSAFGDEALFSSTTGRQNTAIGSAALMYMQGDNNTAIGANTISWITSGSNNTAIGEEAAIASDGLNNSTALGYHTWVNGNNSTAIGSNAAVYNSNEVRIGDDNVTKIGGKVGWSNESDQRLKHDIQDSDLGLDFINKLRPVSFTLNNGDGTDYGFIAQEVENAVGKSTNIVLTDNSPEKYKSMRYDDLIAPMVKAIQQQQEEIKDLKAQVEALKNSK